MLEEVLLVGVVRFGIVGSVEVVVLATVLGPGRSDVCDVRVVAVGVISGSETAKGSRHGFRAFARAFSFDSQSFNTDDDMPGMVLNSQNAAISSHVNSSGLSGRISQKGIGPALLSAP